MFQLVSGKRVSEWITSLLFYIKPPSPAETLFQYEASPHSKINGTARDSWNSLSTDRERLIAKGFLTTKLHVKKR